VMLRRQSHRGLSGTNILFALLLVIIIAGSMVYTTLSIVADQRQRQRAFILRQTVLALQYALNQDIEKKQLKNGNIKYYFGEKLGPIKICNLNSIQEGCWPMTSALSEGKEPGIILENGAMISGLTDASADNGTQHLSKAIVIDWNGDDGPNIVGEDEIWINVCYGEENCNGGKDGLAFYTQSSHTIEAHNYLPSGLNNNITLFNTVMSR
jgi:hypothetical protein